MKKLLIGIILLFNGVFAFAVTPIATCGETNGFSFAPNNVVSKTFTRKLADQFFDTALPFGWVKDGYKDAKINLIKLDDGKYDVIIYNSWTKQTVSSINDGATVILNRKSTKSVVVAVLYPNDSATLYTFMQPDQGDPFLSVIVTKDMDNGFAPMRTTMATGKCEFLNIKSM